MKTATCLVCDKEFQYQPSSVSGLYCSRDCYDKTRLQRLGMCIVCGKEYKQFNRSQRYCSAKCSGIAFSLNHKTVVFNCKECGKEMKVTPFWAKIHKYCSEECRIIGGTKSRKISSPKHQIKRICVVCGIKFEVYPSKLLLYGRGRFCSQSCHGKWMEENVRGENHPNWRGGPTPYKKGWTHRLREETRKRDNYQCQICLKKQDNTRFSVHHIDYSKDNLDKHNLITLCKKCHSRTNGKNIRSFYQAFCEDIMDFFYPVRCLA